MSKQAIACIGQGFVGGTLTIGMCHAFDVYAHDKVKNAVVSDRGNIVNVSDSVLHLVDVCERTPEVNFTGVFFVCVPTPMKRSGEADLRIVESVLNELVDEPGERIAVVKSTIPPGTTEAWNDRYEHLGLTVVFNPEFLREATALDDFLNQDRIILGGPRPQVNVVRDIFKVAYPNIPIHKTSSTNAELVKYVTNTFLATKVSFANEIYQVCEALADKGQDVDYDRTIELATLDRRLGKSHWQVPGPMPADDGTGKLLRGYGGSCFCKDINALIHRAKQLGVTPTMLQAAWNKNVEVRPQRDWERLLGRAVSDETKEENK